MQKVKKILLIVSLLMILSVQTVSAQESVDEGERLEEMTRKGSIQIILPDGEIKKESIEFQCVKVADISDGEYVFLDDFSFDFQRDTTEALTAEEQDQIAKMLAEREYDFNIKRTDSNGKLLFEELNVGVYLLKAEDTKSYGTISPALVAIPTWDEVEKKMEYNIKVIPKYTKEIPQSVKTGDDDNLVGYMTAGVMSLLCILCICVIGRRKFYGRK